MAEFTNATIVRTANVYFGGSVTSRTVILADGEKKTLGIMLPGDYEFDTSQKELMEIQAGKVEILLAGSQEWRTVQGGESFEVAANSSFKIKVSDVTDYCCSYLSA